MAINKEIPVRCRQLPLPACRLNGSGIILDFNSAFAELFPVFDGISPCCSFFSLLSSSGAERLRTALHVLEDSLPAVSHRFRSGDGMELLWTIAAESESGMERTYLAVCQQLDIPSVPFCLVADGAKHGKGKAGMAGWMSVIPVGAAIVDDGVLQDVNERLSEMTGYHRDELVGQRFSVLFAEDAKYQLVEQQRQEQTERDGRSRQELRLIRKDGRTIWVDVTASPIWPAGVEPLYRIAVMQDISARKAAEDALQHQEESYRLVIEQIQDVYFRSDSNDKLIKISPVGVRLLGYRSDTEMLGRPNADFWKYPGERKALLEKLLRDGGVRDYEVVLVRNDETEIPVSISSRIIRDVEGGFAGIEGVFRDISERRRAEDDLRRQKALFESLFAGSPEAIAIVDRNDRVIDINESFTAIFGYARSETLGRPINDLVAGDNACVDALTVSEAVIQRGQIVRQETVRQRKNGSLVEVAVLGFPIRIGTEDAGAFAIYRDITIRRQAERTSRESEERFAKAFQANPAPMVISDIDTGMFLDVNDRWLTMVGYSRAETIGRTSLESHIWDDPEHRQRTVAALKENGFVRDVKTVIRTKTGDIRTALWSAEIITLESREVMLSLIHDTTAQDRAEEQRCQLEEQIRQAQKLEAIGTLAGGVAHDFNNLLTTIMGNVSLIQRKYNLASPVRERIKIVEEMVQRGADLTRQLLGFAKGGKYEVRPVDVNRLLRESLDMFGRTHRDINIVTEFDEQTLPVEIDRGQVHQVLLNIFINAAHAMPGGGKLIIRSGIETIGDDRYTPVSLAAGRYAWFSITDNGHGMDTDTMQRIFDPFFTTKPVGKGTGLGLASAYGIIRNHGGDIRVASQRDVGSTFTIYLPFCQGPIDLADERSDPPVADSGKETILVIDDEEMILEVSQALLVELGYRVLVAGNGRRALSVFSEQHKMIDLVILDMVMPDMDGSTIFDRLREITPDLKILLASGYSVDERARAILDRGCNAFIQKPYSLDVLAGKVREVLDGV